MTTELEWAIFSFQDLLMIYRINNFCVMSSRNIAYFYNVLFYDFYAMN